MFSLSKYVYYLVLLFLCTNLTANKDAVTHVENLENQRVEQQYKNQMKDLDTARNQAKKSEAENRANLNRAKQSEAERMLAIKKIEQNKLVQDIMNILKEGQFTYLTENPPLQPADKSYVLIESLLNYDQFRHQVSGGGMMLCLYLPNNVKDPVTVEKIKHYLDQRGLRYKQKNTFGIVFEVVLFPLF